MTVLGVEEFGELLAEGSILPPIPGPGRYTLAAELRRGKDIAATGSDRIFAADDRTVSALPGPVAVVDTSGVVAAFLAARGIESVPFDPSAPRWGTIIFGAHDFRDVRRLDSTPGLLTRRPILDAVRNGARLIVLGRADDWAQYLDGDALLYINRRNWQRNGRFIAGIHPFLTGLPQACALGWEYQDIYRNDITGIGLDPLGIDIAVAVTAQHCKDILVALCRVPYGNGDIVLCDLNLLPELNSSLPQAAVPRRLFLNMLFEGR